MEQTCQEVLGGLVTVSGPLGASKGLNPYALPGQDISCPQSHMLPIQPMQ